jgi:hypothetical protein
MDVLLFRGVRELTDSPFAWAVRPRGVWFLGTNV